MHLPSQHTSPSNTTDLYPPVIHHQVYGAEADYSVRALHRPRVCQQLAEKTVNFFARVNRWCMRTAGDRLYIVDMIRPILETSIGLFLRPSNQCDITTHTIHAIDHHLVRHPAANKDDSLVFLVPGGGFLMGDINTHGKVAEHISEQSHAPVFIANYDKMTQKTFPIQLNQVLEAYRHAIDPKPDLHNQSSGLGYTPKNIVIMGDSAGGNIILSLLIHLRDFHPDLLPAGAVLLSPLTDMRLKNHSIEANRDSDSCLPAKSLAFVRNGYLKPMAQSLQTHTDTPLFFNTTPVAQESSEQENETNSTLKNHIEALSNLYYVSPLLCSDLSGLPPTYFQVGQEEVLLSDALATHKKIVAHGGESELDVYSDLSHGDRYLVAHLEKARLSYEGPIKKIKRWHGPTNTSTKLKG